MNLVDLRVQYELFGLQCNVHGAHIDTFLLCT